MKRTDVCAAVQRYVEAVAAKDTDALVSMFTEDAVLCEPWGVSQYRGHDEIRKFYRQAESAPFTVSLLTPITVVGNRAVMMLRVHVDGKPDFASTDIFECSPDGRFTSMRALPDPEAVV